MKSLSRTIFFSMLAVLLIASCRTAKEYKRPEVVLQSSFASDTGINRSNDAVGLAAGNGGVVIDPQTGRHAVDTVSIADTNSVADLPWQAFFADPSLNKLIADGITYNHDLLIAMKRIDIATQQVKQARLLNLPSVNLQLSGQINRPSDNSLNGLSTQTFLQKSHVENYSALAGISWEADIWGKLKSRKEVALLEYLRTTEAAKAIQTELVAQIAQGFYNLLMLDQQLLIARRTLALNDSFLTATRLLKDAGNVSLLAVQQAESQKQTTALLIPSLQQDIILQENALQLLTGHVPDAVERKVTLTQLTIPSDLSTGLPIAMVSRRPDVRADEIALKIANQRVGIAQAGMYPSFNITAAAGLEAFKASNWFNIPGSLFGLATGSILQPVFQKRELRTQYEVAKIEREQAVIKFRQSVLVAGTEVANALTQAEKLKEQQDIAVLQTGTTGQAVFNSQQLFKSDMATYLEVITAQSNALQAELNLAQVQRSRLGAMVELYRALGGGWK